MTKNKLIKKSQVKNIVLKIYLTIYLTVLILYILIINGISFPELFCEMRTFWNRAILWIFIFLSAMVFASVKDNRFIIFTFISLGLLISINFFDRKREFEILENEPSSIIKAKVIDKSQSKFSSFIDTETYFEGSKLFHGHKIKNSDYHKINQGDSVIIKISHNCNLIALLYDLFPAPNE